DVGVDDLFTSVQFRMSVDTWVQGPRIVAVQRAAQPAAALGERDAVGDDVAAPWALALVAEPADAARGSASSCCC
ncbi:MAG: hypothetical protein OXG11_01300, partial [Chloroflexi bacterium]|nr:hypothetical protein [Chloroflexota bacterium]